MVVYIFAEDHFTGPRNWTYQR